MDDPLNQVVLQVAQLVYAGAMLWGCFLFAIVYAV